ncbi:hypothetical protein [Bacillus sp. SD088]|uniref:hypothetical protein n=1 Tax=Bacillus sp. SD088 TaxID=2782012 RepID=UPI001A958B03|nr:hypothetical protein [Bacillus sp. SD088]MBO0994539.1 hypothetical protein [Bacillus sp. SD088]
MNPKNSSMNEASDSLLVLWEAMITYHKALLFLWRGMHASGLDERLLVRSIADSYEYMHAFVQFLIQRYELTELAQTPLPLPVFIEETEILIHEIYYFSHECIASLYHIRKISCLQTNILHDLLWLQSISQQKETENNPNTKWLTYEVFNPISTLKEGQK